MPEYQKTLENLVASNALLKHDASELVRRLLELQEENRSSRQEIDDLRAVVGVTRRSSPKPSSSAGAQHLAAEFAISQSRADSSPVIDDVDRSAWRRSVQIPGSTRALYEHARRMSTHSIASSRAATDISGLGMDHIPSYSSQINLNDKPNRALSPNSEDDRQSPKAVLRSSPSGGIGYMVNGVPKGPGSHPRRPGNRSLSLDRRRLSLRNFSVSLQLGKDRFS